MAKGLKSFDINSYLRFYHSCKKLSNSFDLIGQRVEEVLELVHPSVCRLTQVALKRRSKYFFTFITTFL
jgi:hypothetical protein